MRSSELAYLRLRDDILDGTLAPGTPLPEVSLAAQLGVSRTPLREATSRLAHENLVTVVPGKGAFVAQISLADVRELLQVRSVLEPFAARVAAGQPDRTAISSLLKRFESEAPAMIWSGRTDSYRALCAEMDFTISAMTSNRRLQSMLQSAWHEAWRLRSVTVTDPARLLASIDEHCGILRNVLQGDADAAAAATERHLVSCYDNILRLLISNASPAELVDEEFVPNGRAVERGAPLP